jgi:hypothetical protein
MSTVINSKGFVASIQAIDDDAGVIGYINYATPTTLSASSELVGSPASSMTNPSTAFRWIASGSGTQTITINTASQEIDYIGIARHNLNQFGLTVEIKYDGTTVVQPTSVSDNQAILFLQGVAAPSTVEIIISGATDAPSIAVLYIGKSIRLQRNIYVGHTPINYGRDRVAINGVSENGQYLGEIVVRETNSTQVSLQNLTPLWYRTTLDPFFALKPRVPCFWAWRPSTYEAEVGYAWVEGNPRPTNQRSNGMMEISWNFRGIV